MRRIIFVLFFCLPLPVAGALAPELKRPMDADSVRFAVIGDSGSGNASQYQTAAEMAAVHHEFPFNFVLMLGDNIYGGKSPADFKRKFEQPYQPLLDAGVKFYASLGNHDEASERLYKPFHMDGRSFYSFQRGNAEFFALDSSHMDSQQLDWLGKELDNCHATWKICYFHHPLYSDAKTHGPSLGLRRMIEPLFEKDGVSLVWAGHDHVYERLKPQNGIHYFVLGNSGQLRFHDLRPSPETAKGFDTDRTFALVEIAGGQLYFQVISRAGETVDSGVIAANAHDPN
ncbi:MAG TPA: metallophosphoesterase [Bryobacteraceae bacterium]|nr:metallophosphoesterase [Bryobacteraceae bacterium]